LAKILAFFVQNNASIWQNLDHIIGFKEKHHFCRKLVKIAEN
jgi:hypothetical protein